MDGKVTAFAEKLVNYSVNVQKGERVWIDGGGVLSAPCVEAVVRAVYAAGGHPYAYITDERVQRAFLNGLTEKQITFIAKRDAAKMEEMQCYIGLRAVGNAFENSDVPPEKKQMYQTLYSKPVNSDVRVKKTKWVVARYPTATSANDANMSTDAFEDYFYGVCCMDYEKLVRAMEPLKAAMQKTDKVRITGDGTDISFSIKGINAVICGGKNNIPDGELFTAPVAGTLNGGVFFNAPCVFQGTVFENVSLEFERGRVVKAVSNEQKKLDAILNTDAGAKGVGEFSFGLNPFITRPAKNTLFDEKISGSFHMALGACYSEAPNGSESAIHWDMVCIQTPEYGGGKIFFDDVLIREDGVFVLPGLKALNPENFRR